jgi:ATP/maltotriose-dependent transcriptional regulator MalT
VARPVLWERLGASPRVTVVVAPPGSGKTVLLRSWLGQAGLAPLDQPLWLVIDDLHELGSAEARRGCG